MHLGTTDPIHCGCARDSTGDLMPVDEALNRAIGAAGRITAAESVPLVEATGRILAAPVSASRPMPPFDASAMDGYALRSAALAGDGPWEIPVAGRVRAGDPPGPLPAGAALRILTGAPLPLGADAVVPQEQVGARGAGLRLRFRPRPGAHVRRAGSDLAEGVELLPAGRLIGPREVGALAAAGLRRVEVRRRLEVALLRTGSELTPPGAPLDPGRIWDSNGATLLSLLSLPWIRLQDRGTVPDDPAELRRALAAAAEGADLVVTTGGVSVGDEDHLPRAVTEAGGRILVNSVAMKPGKPLTFGQIGRASWIGLPGNPVAAFVGWTVVGARIAEAMAGLAGTGPRKAIVRSAAPAAHRPGRCEFRLARLVGYDAHGVQVAELLPGETSYRVALLARADGLALIPAEAGAVPEGTLLEFLPF
ncbi:gephyrin-like molybdotransferase Glp [Rubellimicrobium mesophilum]|nr:gephyrin-like molybdotransferase Glp [Rubellimicrobium mesophilum]